MKKVKQNKTKQSMKSHGEINQNQMIQKIFKNTSEIKTK